MGLTMSQNWDCGRGGKGQLGRGDQKFVWAWNIKFNVPIRHLNRDEEESCIYEPRAQERGLGWEEELGLSA